MPHLTRSAPTVICLALVAAIHAAPSKQPNFLFVIADDCTYRDIGCYGGQAYTPNIDRLATQGMRFTHCFQSAPMCSPTRHNIYTSIYPVKSGAYPNHTHVNPGVRSVVHYLKPLGYRVALNGKRHIGPADAFPFEYLNKGADPDMNASDRFVAECVEQGKPFCLFHCSHQPHTPWNKGDPSRYEPARLKLPPYFVDTPLTRENLSRYLAEITYFDGQVGDSLAILDRHGIADNTLVIVVSEQGSSFPFGKWTCYDTGLQSAFIARWPGRIPAGVVNDALIEYCDVTPTYIEAAGGTPPPGLDGKSLLPVLIGGKREHKRYVFGEMTTRGINKGSPYYGIRSIRSKRFKYIWNFTPEAEFRNAASANAIFNSWREKAAHDADAADKVRRYQHRPGEELYDVENDPYEWRNLADRPEYADIKAELRRQLLAWMERCGDKGQQTEMEALDHMSPKRKQQVLAQESGQAAPQGRKQKGRRRRKKGGAGR